MKFLLAASIVIALAGCQKTESPKTNDAHIELKEKKPELSNDEKISIIRSITDRSTSVDVDKFKGVAFWKSRPRIEINKPSIYFYLVEPKDAPSLTFRVVYSYIGNDWIFFDRIEILADDEKVIDRKLERHETTERDVLSSKIWESADIKLSEQDAKAFDKIAGAKIAIVRYSGKGQVDLVISEQEKENFSKLAEMYEDARRIDGLEPIGLHRRTAGKDNYWKIHGTTSSKKELAEIRAKSKNLGIDLTISNIGTFAWTVDGPPREGFARASEDLRVLTEAGVDKFVVSKHTTR